MIRIGIDDTDALGETVTALQRGSVVIMPTDTVYGIGCGYDKPETLKKIVHMKARDEKRPIALLVSSFSMADEYALIPPKIKAGLTEVWPGPLTSIFPRRSAKGNEGIRLPNHTFVRDLIDTYGKPLWVTSANRSKTPDHTHIAAVLRDFDLEHDSQVLVVDGGDLPDTMASTVVDFTAVPPRIIREGPVSRERLEEVFSMQFQ